MFNNNRQYILAVPSHPPSRERTNILYIISYPNCLCFVKLDIWDNDVLEYFQWCFFKEIRYSAFIKMLSLKVATLLLLLISTGRMLPGNLLIQTEDEGSNVEGRNARQSQGSDYFGGQCGETTYFKPSMDKCEQYCTTGWEPFDGSQGACVCCSVADYSKCDCSKGSKGHGNYF